MKPWQADLPYNNLPLLPPSYEIETKAILRQCIKSRSALAELKQAAELIPNQSMLINTLPIMEAQASSEIENIVTTNDKLFQHLQMGDEKVDPATKEAMNYRSALFKGVELLEQRPLCTQIAVQVCGMIKSRVMDIRRTTGTELRDAVRDKVIYTPPVGERLIRDKLSNWEQFIHSEAHGLDPLIVMAIAHYQFEAIHPFEDGNGRTGRILNSLFLVDTGLLKLPILYLSRYMIQHKADYYRLLLAVTQENRWEDWIMYMLKGIEETAIWTVSKIEAIKALAAHTRQYVKRVLPNIYSHELVDLLIEQPYTRITNLEKANIAKRQTASRYLQELVRVGVLSEISIGRDKLFLHANLMGLLRGDNNLFREYTM
ncbi:protein adenylyltransferase Fic [Pelistega europaea]|uniref:Fic family protein n=1 Tax=Pelistega europaea TaxID=106147 RepID=A0A7Y4L972_9BURK|nr:Fic family protein [Pelistega europaea]NOL49285.1 Fic family protein [Pelistega europaea]